MKYTSREVLGIFLILIIGLLALGAWHSFSGIMLASDMSRAWQSMVWFFILLSVFTVGAVVWGNPVFKTLGAIVLFLPSFMFIFSWHHLLVSCIAIFFAWWGLRAVQNEIRDRVHFRFFKVVRSGWFSFVFAFSLALSSGYFAFSQDTSWEELVPRFHISEGTSVLTFKAASYLYPDLKKASDDRATVDEFLMSMNGHQEDATALGKSLSNTMIAALKNALYGFPGSKDSSQSVSVSDLDRNSEVLAREIYVRSGREQISAFVGRTVSGDEKISDVFSLAIERKIADLFGIGGEVSRRVPSSTLPLILTTILFLTLMPFGSIFGPVFIFAGFLLFSSVRAAGWVRIISVERNQDILEE